jgi:hypothetical protein
VNWCEVRWSKVKIFGGMCPLSGIYNYVVCMCFSLQYVFLLSNCLRAICFKSLALWRVLINYFFCMTCFIFCVLCAFVLFSVLFPYVYRCLFFICLQVYRPLPPNGNRITVNKSRIISYHVLYRIMPYLSQRLTVF